MRFERIVICFRYTLFFIAAGVFLYSVFVASAITELGSAPFGIFLLVFSLMLFYLCFLGEIK